MLSTVVLYRHEFCIYLWRNNNEIKQPLGMRKPNGTYTMRRKTPLLSALPAAVQIYLLSLALHPKLGEHLCFLLH